MFEANFLDLFKRLQVQSLGSSEFSQKYRATYGPWKNHVAVRSLKKAIENLGLNVNVQNARMIF